MESEQPQSVHLGTFLIQWQLLMRLRINNIPNMVTFCSGSFSNEGMVVEGCLTSPFCYKVFETKKSGNKLIPSYLSYWEFGSIFLSTHSYRLQISPTLVPRPSQLKTISTNMNYSSKGGYMVAFVACFSVFPSPARLEAHVSAAYFARKIS